MAFCIPSKPLSRRLLLRGMGAGAMISVGLPRLSAMLNGNGTAYAQGAPLGKRFGVWFWGNGCIPPLWIPQATGVGAAWALSTQLMPFAAVKQNLTVLTGFEVKMMGEVHHIGPAAVLSGFPLSQAANYTSATIDHLVAAQIGNDMPFRALHLGVSRATANGQGHTVNYASSSGPDAPVDPEYDALAVYQRLFQGGNTTPTMPDSEFAIRQRVLDAVAEDATSLRLRLGVDDARRLDQHLEGINELSSRIATLATGGFSCGQDAIDTTMFPAAPVDQPNKGDAGGEVSDAQNEAMSELLTYALACDLTNTFLMQHGKPAAHYNMGVIGITDDVHDDISHVEMTVGEGGIHDQPVMRSAMEYWYNHCRVLMEKLQNTPDGASNLLENSLVYATSDVSFGFTHSVDEYPILLFGKAGGLINGDQHVRSVGANTSQVLLTLYNLFAQPGQEVTEFGSTEGLVTAGVPEILV